MNIQTERLEDHTARFTVEVEAERLEEAKHAAAKKLAGRVSVPGFRKGKAPYKVVLNYVGEGAILEDALEVLGNEVYKDALDESNVDPYGPGALEDFDLEPQPTFKFIVPLQPTVDLGDYRAIRKDYEAPTIEDEDVDKTLRELQEREAVVEESSKPVAAGNRVTVKIRGEYLDQDEQPEASEAEASETEEDSETESEDSEDEEATAEVEAEDVNPVFIDQDDLTFSLTEDREPAPGFTEALAGATVGEERIFEITYPDDEEEFQHLARRHVRFDVVINKIENVTLPELNDEFAARISKPDEDSEEEAKTLLELRMSIREDLQKSAEDQANDQYVDAVLDEIVEQASFAYPEALVSDQIHHMLHMLDDDLRQRGMNLEVYQKVTGKSHEDLHDDYHDDAVRIIKRSLAVQELTEAEKVEVTEADLDAEIDRVVAQFGEQAAAFRSIYNNDNMRANLRQELLNRKLRERVAQIAKGENPAVAVAEAPVEEAPEAEEVEAADDESDEGDSE